MSKSSARLRHFWFTFHLWIGVGLGILLLPLSVTGSVLVWHDGVDKLMHPARFAVSGAETLAPSAYLAAATGALEAGLKPSALRLPAEPGMPVTVSARGVPQGGGFPPMTTVYLDPPTARVLDVADTGGSFMMIMHRLHGSLMIPGVGRQIVGWLGVAMLISSLTGIYLWWPRNGQFLKGLRWKRQPTINANLHFTLGFWIAVPLATLSFTGAYISFPQTARSVVGLFAEVSPQQQRGPGGPGGMGTPITPALSPDAAAEAVLAANPGTQLLSLSFPAGSNPAWRVQIKDGEATRNIMVDDATGAVKAGRDRAAAQPAAGDAFSRLMRQLHDGTDMGLVWQIVIFVGGIVPAVLTVTGVIMWWRRRGAKKALARRLASAPGE